ncbi:hypothetical protein ACQEVB_39890 [Pseudonocardia sp. CA-107938]|uniref:hypothetical protein n=1 Tax=Pseudonocardia sp. CA-107938 TaxID=3240021 RepID=UPI003D8B69E2
MLDYSTVESARRQKVLALAAAATAVLGVTIAAWPRTPPTATPPAPPTTAAMPSPTPATPPPRPYYTAADWLWNPIPADPGLDPRSAVIAQELGTGEHLADLEEYAVTLRDQSSIPPGTPGVHVTAGGRDVFGGRTVPIPAGTPIPTGEDKALAVLDPASGTAFGMLGAVEHGNGWTVDDGALTPIDGDGRETSGGSSTGSGIARFAAVVRATEIETGQINHALFFSTNMAAEHDLRFPAVKTDGSNMDGMPTPIPEGTRVQLDPTIDLAAVPGITAFELAVGRALQRFGAYAGDNGGARMAIIFEYVPGLAAYRAAGATGDYYRMPHIPWDRLRVLRSFDGR